MNHEVYMKRALQLAELGWGYTNPNPLVGAVIVKDNQIIAEGYHAKLGGDHAEIAAFRNTSKDVRGATLYVNLEPCSHHGQTPPCAEAIIRKGIREVVISMADPNPKVAGRGISMLKQAGIKVTIGVLESKAKKLNEIFIKYITTDSPYVIMKTAMTLDGKIASVTGDSKWISGEASRQSVHWLRQRVSAIMVGSGTICKDNPALTTRLPSGLGKDPIRIVIDSRGDIPLDCQAISGESKAKVILATTTRIDPDKEETFSKKGVRVIKADGPDGHVNLQSLMHTLHALEVDSILLEGGGGLNAAAIGAGIVDKVMVFIAPKIIGGREAVTPVEGPGLPLMQEAIPIKNVHVSQSGQDILIEGYLKGDLCLQE
jgi:diaminohydroxyphosphoribosylaminopyrimidine deaminase/5-amino-6-(5-phosphoribosylamino)uracil reductase